MTTTTELPSGDSCGSDNPYVEAEVTDGEPAGLRAHGDRGPKGGLREQQSREEDRGDEGPTQGGSAPIVTDSTKEMLTRLLEPGESPEGVFRR